MGKLNLPAQFDAKANKLLLAVAQGRLAHKTGNIKASGLPLENEIRNFLSESLPSNIKVASGYFYSASSRCSPEVDILIYEEEEAFRLDPAPQEQHYVPYTSVSVIGQIKNSARDLASAIEQTQKSLISWKEMRGEALVVGGMSDRPDREPPLTFIVCGECTNSALSKLSATLKKAGRPYVDYILFLDRGQIIAGNLDLYSFDFPFIDFFNYRNVNSLHLCAPEGAPDFPKGLGLLWFYFAIVSKLNFDRGNMLRYNEFCRHFERMYKLRPLQKLI